MKMLFKIYRWLSTCQIRSKWNNQRCKHQVVQTQTRYRNSSHLSFGLSAISHCAYSINMVTKSTLASTWTKLYKSRRDRATKSRRKTVCAAWSAPFSKSETASQWSDPRRRRKTCKSWTRCLMPSSDPSSPSRWKRWGSGCSNGSNPRCSTKWILQETRCCSWHLHTLKPSTRAVCPALSQPGRASARVSARKRLKMPWPLTRKSSRSAWTITQTGSSKKRIAPCSKSWSPNSKRDRWGKTQSPSCSSCKRRPRSASDKLSSNRFSCWRSSFKLWYSHCRLSLISR